MSPEDENGVQDPGPADANAARRCNRLKARAERWSRLCSELSAHAAELKNLRDELRPEVTQTTQREVELVRRAEELDRREAELHSRSKKLEELVRDFLQRRKQLLAREGKIETEAQTAREQHLTALANVELHADRRLKELESLAFELDALDAEMQGAAEDLDQEYRGLVADLDALQPLQRAP